MKATLTANQWMAAIAPSLQHSGDRQHVWVQDGIVTSAARHRIHIVGQRALVRQSLDADRGFPIQASTIARALCGCSPLDSVCIEERHGMIIGPGIRMLRPDVAVEDASKRVPWDRLDPVWGAREGLLGDAGLIDTSALFDAILLMRSVGGPEALTVIVPPHPAAGMAVASTIFATRSTVDAIAVIAPVRLLGAERARRLMAVE